MNHYLELVKTKIKTHKDKTTIKLIPENELEAEALKQNSNKIKIKTDINKRYDYINNEEYTVKVDIKK